MKRTLLASILGIAVSVTSSYGDGVVIFSTYFSSVTGVKATWPDTSGNPPPGHTVGSSITAADGFSAELYYGLGSGLSFSALTALPSSITTVGSPIPGVIIGPDVTLPGWTTGPVTFSILLWNGPGYGLGTYESIKSTWTEPASTIVPIGITPPHNFTEPLLEAAYPYGFFIVPEPSSYALFGLGVGSWLVSRRRKATTSSLK